MFHWNGIILKWSIYIQPFIDEVKRMHLRGKTWLCNQTTQASRTRWPPSLFYTYSIYVTLTQTNTGISVQTSHSSADRSPRRPSLFYSCLLHPATPRLLPCSRQNTDGKSFRFYQVVILLLFCSVGLGLSLSARATRELHRITACGGRRARLQIAFTLQQAGPDKWTSYQHLLLDIHQWLATKEAQSKWVLG